MQIGIGITTVPIRSEIHKIQLKHFERFAPKDAIIYVHNDWQGKGIAKSKNACLETLMDVGCTNIFLFDDDCYPIKADWHLPFIMSGINHASVTFTHHVDGTPNKHKLTKTFNGLDYFSNGCGMCLYFTRYCISQIGGMDIRYSKWGYEHGGLSMRIRNAGLTPSTFIAPVKVMDYFYAADQHKSIRPIFTHKEKAEHGRRGLVIANQEKISKDWKPYGMSDYVLTAFYTRATDEQRQNRYMMSDTKLTETLIKSAPCPVVCFTDIARPREPKFKFVSSLVNPKTSLYNQRFIEYYRWLKRNLEYCNIVYLLDSTDTEFIGKRHKIERGKIYMNTERECGNLKWLLNKSASLPNIDKKAIALRGNDIWNCGVIYGYAEDILVLLEAMQPFLKSHHLADMPAVNHIANKGLPGIEFVPVKSGFKSTDKENVYIRHK